MSEEIEVWVCPHCGYELNIAQLGFFAELLCEQCNTEHRVHTNIANYSLEGILGVGGMSVVLHARDLVLERNLAVKLLNDVYKEQPERIAAFARECLLMAKVHHPNVVELYTAAWSNNHFFIAMEMIDGENLEQLLYKGISLSQWRVMLIAKQVVRGLAAAHNVGILHRDMKPSNIMITRQGLAKVFDFGLSLQSNEDDNEEIIWATPYYVAPETLRCEAEDVRTDIYALGMTLRHLLTGQDKFFDDGKEPENVSEMLEAKRTLKPFDPVALGLYSDICDLVNHMTSFAPDARPSSYTEIETRIDEILLVLEEARKRSALHRFCLKFASLITSFAAVFCSAFLCFYLIGTESLVKKIELSDDSELIQASFGDVDVAALLASETHDPLAHDDDDDDTAVTQEPVVDEAEAVLPFYQEMEPLFKEKNWLALSVHFESILEKNEPSLEAFWAANMDWVMKLITKQDAQAARAIISKYMPEESSLDLAQDKKIFRSLKLCAEIEQYVSVPSPRLDVSYPDSIILLHALCCAYSEGEAGDLIGAQAAFTVIESYATSGNLAYTPLAEAIIAWRDEFYITQIQWNAFNQFRMTRSAKDTREHAISLSRNARTPESLRTEAQICSEICEGYMVLEDVLSKRFTSTYNLTLKPDELEAMFGKLNSAKQNEYMSAYYFYKGNYAMAEAYLKKITDKDSPFVFLAQDWLSRIEKNKALGDES